MKIFTTCVALLSFSLIAQAAPRKINGIAAKANGRVVTINEVNFHMAGQRAQLAALNPRKGKEYYAALAELKKKTLDELIDIQLLIHEFKTMGAQIPEHAVTSTINREIQRQHNGDKAKYRAKLKAFGMTNEQYRKVVKDRLMSQVIRAQHINEATPATQAELRAEYNKHKEQWRDHSKDRIDFEKIYVPKVDSEDLLATPESQLELAEEIIKKVKKGESFAELAKKHSTDAFAQEGGKQKNVSRQDLVPVISQILFGAPVGQILDQPLEDTNGYHIIRVTKKIKGPAPTLSDPQVKKFIERQVQDRKSSVRFNRFMERLRRKAIIEKN